MYRTNNPVGPDLPVLTQDKEPSADTEVGTGQTGHYLWSFQWIAYDPEKDTIEVIPSRQVPAHWNVLRWLEQGPCSNCLEPYRIDFEEQPIDGGLTPDGGSTKLVIDVYDHQGNDSYKAPIVECAEIFDAVLTATFENEYEYYSRWAVTVSNDNYSPAGSYKIETVAKTDKIT